MKPSLAVAFFLLLSAPAPAQEGGSCLTADPPPPGEVQPLRFGITPRLAGSAGVTQEEPAAEDLTKNTEALTALRPNHRKLVLRLNRLFWSDGVKGIRELGRLVRHYALAGFRSEIQVRYHPPEGHEGDIAGFEQFVATAVAAPGPPTRRRRILDHERGEPADLAEHLGWGLRGRRRRAGPWRGRRAT